MISVTDEAKDLLYDVLEQAEQQGGIQGQDVAIRLAPANPQGDSKGGQVQLGLLLDHSQTGDQVVEYNGKKVLVVDESTADLLEGTTLDAVDTPEGRRLAINQEAA